MPASVAHSSAFVDGLPVEVGCGRADAEDDAVPEGRALGCELVEGRGVVLWVGAGLGLGLQSPRLAQDGTSEHGGGVESLIAQANVPRLHIRMSVATATPRGRGIRLSISVSPLMLW